MRAFRWGVAVLLSLACVPAFATDPAIDLTSAISGASTQLFAIIQSVSPVLLLIMGVIVGLGLVLKLLRMVVK